MTSGAVRIAAAAVQRRGAKRVVCAAIGAMPAGRHSAPSLARRCRVCVARSARLAFGAPPGEGGTIREAAERCGIAPSAAFRWCRCFLEAVRQAPDRLVGIVEADETFVLESRKGERKLDRKPRRRGGKARKRGLSRAGAGSRRSRSRRRDPRPYPARSQRREREGGAGAGRRAGRLARLRRQPPLSACRSGARDISHESIDDDVGERVRGALHIQTVNSHHSRIKGFSCEAFAASPPSISTALSGGSISSSPESRHRREPVSRRR